MAEADILPPTQSVKGVPEAALPGLRDDYRRLRRLTQGFELWGIRAEAVREYVLARYRGADPEAAVARWAYGAELAALGPGGQRDVRERVAALREAERTGLAVVRAG